MCGRFIITKKIDEITERFHVEIEEDKYKPVYNAAPSQQLPVISNSEPERIRFFRWGLVPFWAKDQSIGNKMINARSETLLEKPAFRNLLKSKRCLVISDGFYEWQKTEKGKIPTCIRLKNNELFSMAGLWDQWKDTEGQTIHSFSIITCAPNELMAPIHNRMPVILNRDQEKIWLDNSQKSEELVDILKPYNKDDMNTYEVSSLVNSPRNNFEELILPV
ncbi:MAG: SOS response-associated peptidase [Bacteroidetes bacterium]|jgi:putative SOS response-associated peptidase YedK|nr:SOS response-associated peptidase [Bacteroidota bacterium]MBT3935664.1 SOS response-associated peptidase [Bacteroidota bacterium]MBT4970434.1 SOS response-associated peptidase [Bacteroidota bacterium]MBT5992281.1 SOS response-associated peptidase [Bacteroidota bacterium]